MPSPSSSLHLLQPVVKVRTHFSYSASVDQELPCQEAGLSFERGEILHVVNQEDPAWWQAVRKGETVISGLIPSLLQQQRKEYAELVLNSAHKKTGTLSEWGGRKRGRSREGGEAGKGEGKGEWGGGGGGQKRGGGKQHNTLLLSELLGTWIAVCVV